MNLSFPSNAELIRIERELIPDLTKDDPFFDLFPIVNKDFAVVEWEQQDNFTGLMQARGLNGEPGNLKLLGGQRYEMVPGRYGEYVAIKEADIEKRRQWGSFNRPIPIDDLVMEAQDRLLNHRLNRMRWIGWTLLTTGTFSVPAPQGGGIIHTDTFPFQTQAAAVSWATVNTAAPLADFRAAKLKHRGHSVRFDRAGKAFMNLKTANNLLNNNNPADLSGKRRDVGATVNSLDNINEVFTANDLPNIEIYDEGYLDTSNVFQPWIGDNIVVIVGKRLNGDPLGEFQVTRNAANADASPGPYTYVTDSLQTGRPVPRVIRVDDGFNGGPAFHYPSGVIILSV